MDMTAEDRALMGSQAAASRNLAAKLREWRNLRQPFMGTAKEHKARERRENQLRFEICNAGLLWLWHLEN